MMKVFIISDLQPLSHGCLPRPCSDTEVCIPVYPVAGDGPSAFCRYMPREIKVCDSGPCQNGGSCEDLVSTYTCHCLAGYTGDNCQTDIDECASSPCQNGGSCADQVNVYTCHCPAGFTGDHCENDIDECACGPCQNGGNCTDWVDGFTCDCQAGYTGALCENDIDECASSPCQTGGSCVDQVNAYTCDCPAGFTGDHCETDIDDCACGPCQNGGDCTDWVDGFTCDCLAGYTGALCEYDIDECASSPCQNGGSCVDQVNAYTCDCTNGYAGVNCENGVWLNSACTETCEWNMTACFSGRCLCKDGYYFSHSQYACVRSCAELTQTFLRYENFDLEDHDMSAGGGGRAEASLCKAMCIDNQCKAFVHLYMSEWTSCYFKDGSATEHPGSWISKDVTDTYQRTCV
ncbi:fibropellin-3-like [Littorina saxatilis]|uniref:fibropellin-3-like n=1 Tax=Littorina saxatilis TaxID=31220 RepID=UPI0038B46313